MSSPTEERYSLESLHSKAIRLIVEGKEYRIDAHFLARDSPVLREMFAVASQTETGAGPAHTLEGVTKEELENLLWLYYNPITDEARRAHPNVWLNILKLAELWEMNYIRCMALDHLWPAKLEAIEKIKLCERDYLGRYVAKDAYIELCVRSEPLSAAEFQALGIDLGLFIMRIREQVIANRKFQVPGMECLSDESVVETEIGPETLRVMRRPAWPEDYC